MSLLPEYEEAVQECWHEAVDHIMRASDPVLGMMPPAVRTPHVPMAASTPETSLGYYAELQPIEGRFEMAVDAFLTLDLSAWDTALAKCAESTLPQVMGVIFKSLHEATEQSGNVVETGGRKLSFDLLLDAVESVEHDFNDDGTPKPMQWIVSPKMAAAFRALGPPTPEQETRHRDIMRRKWEAHLARRRVRKLDK